MKRASGASCWAWKRKQEGPDGVPRDQRGAQGSKGEPRDQRGSPGIKGGAQGSEGKPRNQRGVQAVGDLNKISELKGQHSSDLEHGLCKCVAPKAQ